MPTIPDVNTIRDCHQAQDGVVPEDIERRELPDQRGASLKGALALLHSNGARSKRLHVQHRPTGER